MTSLDVYEAPGDDLGGNWPPGEVELRDERDQGILAVSSSCLEYWEDKELHGTVAVDHGGVSVDTWWNIQQ